MAKPKLGRPKGKVLLQKEEIIKTALQILDQDGPKGLSMRSLAERLKVTPMALYHHVSDRSALLREVSDRVYGEVSKKYEKSSGSVREKLESLLISYHRAVIKHPHLSLSIFETPDAFSDEAKRITQCIMDLLMEAKLSAAKRTNWLNILVDFTHGSSIATAMGVEKQSAQYAKELKLLLDCVIPSTNQSSSSHSTNFVY